MDLQKAWKQILDILKQEVSSSNFSGYFKTADLEEVTDEKIVISVPSAFLAETIKSKFRDHLGQATKQVLGKELLLEIKIDPSKLIKLKEGMEQEDDLFLTPHSQPYHSIPILNPKYTIENFVVGLSNNLAYAAVQAIVANPGLSYNPLFIYGPSGVGKTHLMQAIGHSLLKNNPSLKVLYAPSEKFMNEFVESIQTKQMGSFRSKYRNCDLFLIDDIQFISGRDATQEEFFHTFNEIHSKSLQIVLTSDKPPGDIQKLEPRLVSRFQGGLMVDIQLPDFDTRMAILKSKLLERGESLSEEVLQFLAETTPSNTRELEGKIIQLLSMKLQGQEITLDLIKGRLPQTQTTKRLDHKKVLTQVNEYFNIKMADLIGPRRQKELVLPRQITMYILHIECKLPFEKVGELLGGRDHTTVMHGVDKIRNAKDRDREIQSIMNDLMAQFN